MKVLRSSLQTAATAFSEFKNNQSAGGIIMVICALIALVWANSSALSSYTYLLHMHFALHLGDWGMNMQLETWVNDGLMSIFFLLVGLEIKRELLIGELNTPKKALLPVVAALGGMVFPALIFIICNFNHPEFMPGWAIPMATDIAFALGVLSLLGKRVSRNLMVLLAAIAIADDLGAVLVIASFYTHTLHWAYLLSSLILFCLLLLLNMLEIRRLTPYLLVGLGLWYCMLQSGIHATIAGVLLAAAIPCRLGTASESDSPLKRLEHALHTPVNFIIVPVFVLFNAGVTLSASHLQHALYSSLSLGIVLGLLLGKCIGLFTTSYGLIRMGYAKLPHGVTFPQIFSLSLLGGIGFTMSIFIANLAYPGDNFAINIAKIGIFAASVIAALLGYVGMRFATQKPA